MDKDSVTWNEVLCTIIDGVVSSIGKDYIKFSFIAISSEDSFLLGWRWMVSLWYNISSS